MNATIVPTSVLPFNHHPTADAQDADETQSRFITKLMPNFRTTICTFNTYTTAILFRNLPRCGCAVGSLASWRMSELSARSV